MMERTDRIATARAPKSLLRDERGALLVEYAVLVGVVGLVVAAALVRSGGSLVNPYQVTRDALIQPYP